MGTIKKAIDPNIWLQFPLIKAKKYEELLKKIRDLIRSITNNSDNYDEKYMKIKLNSDENLRLNKTLEIHNIVIVIR